MATAEFPARPLGFRVPSLFVTGQAPTMTDGALLSAVTEQNGVLTQYAAAAAKTQQLMMEWMGESPLAPLNVLDHDGQPFEDGALLVTPIEGGIRRRWLRCWCTRWRMRGSSRRMCGWMRAWRS